MCILSFSSAVKNELCRIEVNGNCCLLAELAAVIRISGTVKFVSTNEMNIRIVTENAAFARKVFSLIKKLYNINPEITIRKSRKLKKHISYTLVITASMGAKQILDSTGITFDLNEGSGLVFNATSFSKNLTISSCCKKAFLRGAFLAGGSVSDPEKTYHLEITTHSNGLSLEISGMINKFKLNAKVIKRKGNYVVYIKEGEDIVNFLNIIGAHSALMELENVRILKEMRNNVNRIVNCETANLGKMVNASVRQVENIKYLADHKGLNNLPASLKEIAEIRLEYSDATLKELGEMLNPKLGKSGVNHRLRKLDAIAEKLRELKGDL